MNNEADPPGSTKYKNYRAPAGGTALLRKTQKKRKRSSRRGTKRDQEKRSRQEKQLKPRLKNLNITGANNIIGQRVPTPTRYRKKM